MLSASHEPLPSLGLPCLCTLKRGCWAQLRQAGGRGRGQWSLESRGWAGGEQGTGERNKSIQSPRKRLPGPFDLPGQTFLLLFPFVYWKGCIWCSFPFSSVHGTARGSRCSRNLFWRKTCFEHQEKMGKLAVLIIIIRKQNLFLIFDMSAA